MFTIDGYVSLQQFFLVAKSAVNKKMSARWSEVVAEWEKTHDRESEEGPRRSEFWIYNMERASQFLVLDVFSVGLHKTGKLVQVLKPDGSRIGVPLSLLFPTTHLHEIKGVYANLRREKQKEKFIDKSERVFGLDTLKLEFWPDLFLNGQVFSDRPMQYARALRDVQRSISVVSWQAGCINVKSLRALVTATEHLARAVDDLRQISCEPPAHMLRAINEDGGHASNVYKMLEPLDACSIIAPEEWLQELKTLAASDGRPLSPEVPPVSVREAIISLLMSGTSANKQDVKSKILEMFPSVSHRQFDRHWTSVAEQKPELRRPGRKSKQRIETVF